MTEKDRGEGRRAVEAVVVELLPQSGYLLELSSRAQVKAHAAGAGKVNFSRLRPNDKVLVELSPHDPTRGRIVKLLPA
ncbi:MAG: translation initiation factor IF-1 [Candidatus Solibacter usitatus]|nr:translation initiation factor IF-1 [Candidatus Solibacter usitatus]